MFFSSDTIYVGEDSTLLAEMYFRIKADMVLHKRVVFALMDWLGSLGGVGNILMKIINFFCGGYLQFNAVLCSLNALNVKEEKKADGEDGEISSLK